MYSRNSRVFKGVQDAYEPCIVFELTGKTETSNSFLKNDFRHIGCSLGVG